MKSVRLKKSILSLLLIFTLQNPNALWAASDARYGNDLHQAAGSISENNEYLEKLENFRRNLNMQVNLVFIPQVRDFSKHSPELASKIIETANYFSRTMNERLIQFSKDYEQRFIEYDRDVEVKKRLVDGEADIKWAAEMSFTAMIDILNSLENDPKSSRLKREIEKNIAIIQSRTNDIEAGKEIIPQLSDTIKKVTPVKTGLFRTLCSAVTRMCLNQNLSKIIRELPPRPFLRSENQKAEFVFVSRDGSKSSTAFSLPENAAIVIAMNHDNASLDGMYLQEVAKILKVDRNIILTTKDAWPHIALLAKLGISHKDTNILFKQDKDMKQKALDALMGHGRVAFSIFPEGELPFWHIQFPLFANFGAFSIARTAAFELRDKKPVFYIEVQSNFLTATTSKNNKPIQIEIYQPEEVPTEPIGDRDAWVESHREQFEKRANADDHRGKMVDMIAREKISADGRIYVADDVQAYQSPGQLIPRIADQKKDNRPIFVCRKVFIGL